MPLASLPPPIGGPSSHTLLLLRPVPRGAHRARHDARRLRACRVEPIGRTEAVSVIVRYEHLGTVGNSRVFFGLRAPDDRLLGVVGFGNGAPCGGRRLRCSARARLDKHQSPAQQWEPSDWPGASVRTAPPGLERG
jgi:hypothetical protein